MYASIIGYIEYNRVINLAASLSAIGANHASSATTIPFLRSSRGVESSGDVLYCPAGFVK